MTGNSDTAGVVYLRLRAHGGIASTTEIEWVSDGVRWEPPDPDDPNDAGDTLLRGVRFPATKAEAWVQQRTSVEEAHQTLLVDLDAYVPGLRFSRNAGLSNTGRLEADNGHEDCLIQQFIERIDVVRFGPLKEFSESASRQLEAAVGRVDSKAIQLALDVGATTGRLPESRDTALWLALKEAAGYDAKNRPVSLEVVKTLLAAGANPNELADRAASAFEHLLQIDYAQSHGKTKKVIANRLNTLDLLNTLIDSGLDVNSISYGIYAHGYRPLHIAALKNHPEIVRRLLESGANRTLTNDRDATPLVHLREHFDSQANRLNKQQRVPVEENMQHYDEVLKLLDSVP